MRTGSGGASLSETVRLWDCDPDGEQQPRRPLPVLEEPYRNMSILPGARTPPSSQVA